MTMGVEDEAAAGIEKLSDNWKKETALILVKRFSVTFDKN